MTTENNTSLVKLPIFDGNNFSNWKYRFRIWLDERGLRKYVEEGLEAILAGVSAENRDKTRLEEKKCVSVLVQTMHASQLE